MQFFNELLFWAHLAFILFAISLGIFLPLGIVAILILLHRIHIFLFNGCLFSNLQKRIGGFPKHLTFLQHAAAKLFKRTISIKQSKALDYTFALSALALAII